MTHSENWDCYSSLVPSASLQSSDFLLTELLHRRVQVAHERLKMSKHFPFRLYIGLLFPKVPQGAAPSGLIIGRSCDPQSPNIWCPLQEGLHGAMEGVGFRGECLERFRLPHHLHLVPQTPPLSSGRPSAQSRAPFSIPEMRVDEGLPDSSFGGAWRGSGWDWLSRSTADTSFRFGRLSTRKPCALLLCTARP